MYGGTKLEKWEVGDAGDPDDWIDLVNANENLMVACFGAGCFWGTEKFFAKDFAKKHPEAIIGTSVGFMNPDPKKCAYPSYEEVCEGNTGHVEVIFILYD